MRKNAAVCMSRELPAVFQIISSVSLERHSTCYVSTGILSLTGHRQLTMKIIINNTGLDGCAGKWGNKKTYFHLIQLTEQP
ncbi:MAG: hypothetical protein LBP85_02820 [Prevotellaceae bacterium]|jgi:hypothetical protein|nr:hypothetical protein [Prevotellaceae bacterium]